MQIVTPQSLTDHHPRRVVVAGSGYAGMTFAVTLAHRLKPSDGIEIVMIAPLPYQQALSELDLVSAGTPRPQWAELWHGDIFRGLPIKVVYDRLENVCPADSRVSVGPANTPTASFDFWRLVIATGAIPSLPPVAGLSERAITIWSVDDALTLQQRIDDKFKAAASIADPEARKRAMSVAVVGGGATGVEIVGAIASVVPKVIRRSGHDPAMLELTLLEGRPDILYDLAPDQRAKAVRRLRRLGVDLVLGEKLARVEDGFAFTDAGHRIPAETLVWCGGAKADPDAADWGLPLDASGRIIVRPDLSVEGHSDIFAIGDVAAFRDPKTSRVIPMLAQFAIREAAHTAKNVARDARGGAREEFTPNMHGEFVSVGPYWGVGWMFRMPISGWFAIVMKRLTYVMYWLEVGTLRLAWRRTLQMLRMHRY